MKIYRRKEFLDLPEGTLYCQARQKWSFADMQVKNETITAAGDWLYTGLNWVEGSSTEEEIDALESMLGSGVSYPMNTTVGRDGLFNDDALFLVYEREDLMKLRDYVDAALAVAE